MVADIHIQAQVDTTHHKLGFPPALSHIKNGSPLGSFKDEMMCG